MSQNKFGRFLSGVLVGIGLGILVAPDKGENTRLELRKSFDKLINTIKDIDIESTKAALINKLAEIESDLTDLDTAKKTDIVKEKTELINQKCDELISVANNTDANMLNDVIKEVKKNTTKLANTVLNSLEESEETPSKTKKLLKKVKLKSLERKVKKTRLFSYLEILNKHILLTRGECLCIHIINHIITIVWMEIVNLFFLF